MITRKVRCRQKCGRGRTGQTFGFRAMTISEARKLEKGDPVSVVGPDGKRTNGVVVAPNKASKTVSILVAYECAMERIKNHGRTMTRLIVPVREPVNEWRVGAHGRGLDF